MEKFFLQRHKLFVIVFLSFSRIYFYNFYTNSFSKKQKIMKFFKYSKIFCINSNLMHSTFVFKTMGTAVQYIVAYFWVYFKAHLGIYLYYVSLYSSWHLVRFLLRLRILCDFLTFQIWNFGYSRNLRWFVVLLVFCAKKKEFSSAKWCSWT